MAYTLDDLTDVPSGIYDRLKQKFVNFNKPDAEFADLPYEAQTAAIERRQKLADLLQQQSRTPIEIQSYKGIQAPIATTAGLAKILDAAMAGYEEGDTATQAKEAAKAQEADTKYTLGEVDKATSPAYRQDKVTVGSLAPIAGSRMSTGDITALPEGAVAPDSPGYDSQAEMAKIPSAFGNRQALDNGYTGLSGQSLQQGSHQDLVKALLHSKVTALRNAGLTMATTPEKLYEVARGGKLVNASGDVRAVGAPVPLPKGSFQEQSYDAYVARTLAAGGTPLPAEKWINANRPPKVPRAGGKNWVTAINPKTGVSENPLLMTDAQAAEYARTHPRSKGFKFKITPANALEDMIEAAVEAASQRDSGFTVERE